MNLNLTMGYPARIDLTPEAKQIVGANAHKVSLTLRGVKTISQRGGDRSTIVVEFEDADGFRQAQAATGWTPHGLLALKVKLTPDYAWAVDRTYYWQGELERTGEGSSCTAITAKGTEFYNWALVEDEVQVVFTDDPGTETLRQQEAQTLKRILNFLQGAGWEVESGYDGGDDWEHCESVEDAVSLAESVYDSTLMLRHSTTRRIGHIYIVRGNSPIEMIVDHSVNGGFGEAVDAALRHVFPNYPEE